MILDCVSDTTTAAISADNDHGNADAYEDDDDNAHSDDNTGENQRKMRR